MAFLRLLFLLIPAAVATLFGIGIYENEHNMAFGWQPLVLIFVAGTVLLALAIYTSWRVAKWIVGRLGRNQTPLMADAHKRRFDIVCVWKFDRFARSVSHLLRALETFKALGIEFCSYSEQLDTSTPAGKMVFTVLGAVAELERSLIAERVRAGLRNARAKGKTLGRPRVTVDASQVATLRSQGASWPAIARSLGVSVGKVWQAAHSLS